MADRNMDAKIKVNPTTETNKALVSTGDNINTAFGKINKNLSDLKDVAFSGSYNDLSNKPNIPNVINNLTSDSTTDALAAAQGKELKRIIDISAMEVISDKTPLSYVSLSENTLTNYQVYGTVAGVGIATETGEPAGYKITLTNTSGVTENLFSSEKSDIQLIETSLGNRYGISLSPSAGTYTIKSYSIPEVSSLVYGCIKYADESFSTYFYVVSTQTFTKTIELSEGDTLILYNPLATGTQDSTYTAISESDILIISGSTAPDHYIPHRYTSNYDLFIGDSKLVNEEYLDYAEQKIYKRNPPCFTYPVEANGNYIDPSRPSVNFIQVVWEFNVNMLSYLDRGGLLIKIGLSDNFDYSTASAKNDYTSEQLRTSWETTGKNSGHFQVNSDTYPEISFRTFVKIGSDYFYGEIVQVTKTEIDNAPNKTINYPVLIPYLPVDPPLPFPAITAYDNDNTLDSIEALERIDIEGLVRIYGGYLPLSGGTVTGNLTVNGGFLNTIGKYIYGTNTNINRDTNPSADTTGNAAVRLQDNSSKLLVQTLPIQYTDGTMQVSYIVYNTDTNGNQIQNSIALLVDKNGNKTYAIEDPANFRAAIGLNNVDNTSDANKPISTATQTALNAQQAQIDDNSEISEITDTTPYLYKLSEHDAVYDELVGGSVAWNQLVANSGSSLSVTITSGHKYVMKKSGTLSVGASSGSAITGLTGGTDWITDLTLMFGTTIADYVYTLEQSATGSGIEWLKSYGFFTEDYYAYNTGELMSVNTSGKKAVGKNLVDIPDKTITAAAYIFNITGLNLLSGTYTFSFNSIGSSIPSFAAKYEDGTDAVNANVNNHKLTFTADKKIVSIRLYGAADTYSNMQLELGSTATNYEPYTSITYPIQSTDLRGIYKLDSNNKLYTDGDIYSADGTVTRKYGIVDLGTLDWTYSIIAGSRYGFAVNLSSLKNATSGVPNILCSKYVTYSLVPLYPTTSTLTGVTTATSYSGLIVFDDSYTDAATFKTAMSGVYLIYELAEPTTETAQPFISPQMVYHNGTEEYLDTREVSMPVGGNRKYVDIPEWMVNEYFDDLRTSAYKLSETKVSKSGDTMTGDLTISKNGSASVIAENTNAKTGIRMNAGNSRCEIQSYMEDEDDISHNWYTRYNMDNVECYHKTGSSTDIHAFYFEKDGENDYIGDNTSNPDSALELGYSNVTINGNQILTNGNTSPLNHNGIFRGKDLTNVYTIEEMYEMIHSGNFDELYLGDYFTVSINTDLYIIFTGSTFAAGTTYYERSGADLNHWVYTPTTDTEPQSGKHYYTMTATTKDINLMYAAFDYYYNVGNPALTSHHAVLIPRESNGLKVTAAMNLTNTVEGGYFNSYMHQTTLPCYAKSLKAALNNHMLMHRTFLTTVTDDTVLSMTGGGLTGASTKGAWCDTELQLMSIRQVFGNASWSSSSFDCGVDNKILPVFNYINSVEYMNYAFWLRDVALSTGFAWSTSAGSSSANLATVTSGVRPQMLFG